MKLDYTLETPEERVQLVSQLVQENPNLSSTYLDNLTDYILLAASKQERKQKQILTENRLATINKRETSYEGLAATLENGEDGIANLARDNKNALLQPRISITQKDLAEIPELAGLRSEITKLEQAAQNKTGRDAYIYKRMLIDMRKDQYIIKNIFRLPVQSGFSLAGKPTISLNGFNYLDAAGNVQSEGITFTNPTIIAEILANYSHLKEDGYAHYQDDTWYLMEDFDKLCENALKNEPLLERLVEYKIDGRQNSEIQKLLEAEFSTTYSIEYLSSLWKKKIPKIIAVQAQKDWLEWHFTEEEKGHWKRCSRCKEIKLAHPLFFSRNSTSKDKFYSLCKDCRNKKGQKK